MRLTKLNKLNGEIEILGLPQQLYKKLYKSEEAEEQGECKTDYDENHIPYMVEATGSEAKHIIELLTMEAQGLLLKPQHRLGEVVYDRFANKWEIFKIEFLFVDGLKRCLYRCGLTDTDHYMAFYDDEIVYKTEAEALQALKEGK